MAKLVSKTYGDALFAAVADYKDISAFYQAAKLVVELLQEHGDFCRLMVHPKVAKEEKERILKETFAERIPSEIVGVLILLIRKGHADEMIPVCEHFIALVKEVNGIGEASVTTAIELGKTQRAKIEQKLLETTRYQSLEMQYDVDVALIGGMVIRIGDRVVDSSIKTKLQKLSKELREVQV